MVSSRPHQSVSEWDPRLRRMLGVSLAGHILVLAAGLGGIWVEVLNDTSLRLLPVDAAEVRRMLGELRGLPPQNAQAQQPAAATPAATAPPAYAFLNLDEAAFVEALVDHMVPADDLTPKGTDIGINIYIDRALSGAWGKGDRLYMQQEKIRSAAHFRGVQATAVVGVLGLTVASTGASEKGLRRAGFTTLDRTADYYGYGLTMGDAEVRLADEPGGIEASLIAFPSCPPPCHVRPLLLAGMHGLF